MGETVALMGNFTSTSMVKSLLRGDFNDQADDESNMTRVRIRPALALWAAIPQLAHQETNAPARRL
jgi:hypothetical protein